METKQTHNDMSTKLYTASNNTTSNASVKSNTNEQIISDSTIHEQCAAVQTRAMVARKADHANHSRSNQFKGWT